MILIVDDFSDAAEPLCRLLMREGYPCRWVNSGHEALAAIRAHPPEQPLLVVLDDMMPETDGVTVLRMIRNDPRIAATPVVFHTAGFDLAKREAAMNLGALGWFYKGGVGSLDAQTIVQRFGEIYERVGGAKSKADRV